MNRISASTRVLTAIAFVAAAAAAPVATLADPNDVAFDQLQRIYLLGSEPPPLGSFDDLRATFALLGPSATYPPLPGSLSGVQRQREGVLYHYSFLGGLERVDDPAAAKATIGRPDRNEVDYLDTHAKTYAVVTGDAAKAMLQPNLVDELETAMNARPNGATSGSMAMTIKASTTLVQTHAFDGTGASGFLVDSSVGTTATGQCPALTAKIAVTLYVDATRTEPFVKPNSTVDVGQITKMMGSLGCKTTIEPPVPVPDPAIAHFLYYERGDVTMTLPMLPGPIQSASVLERAHVRPLTAADAGLFEIPAGFTRVDPPPPPSAPGGMAVPPPINPAAK
ncbi:MAG: hypothetical protein IAI48_01875 [Candidatus Eremiobacteraeota bacterium]|nr:hypothetical protein [Candidatus Eremiobacteraeota bacterium]